MNSSTLQALILTKNEEPNLERVLDKLTWLEKVVILDSFSTDRTINIANNYKNVVIFQRDFDTHGLQWNFGLSKIDSEWVLTLDADYVLSDGFVDEIKLCIALGSHSAYDTKFKFLVFGKALIKDNTTPRPVLFKKSDCIYFDDGHTQRLKVNGSTGLFKSIIYHDDRKSLSRWLSNQDAYSVKEAYRLLERSGENLPLSSKFRKTKIIAPFLVFFYSLFIKGLIFNGWRGWHYTLQRTIVEMILAVRLIEEEKLKKDIEI